MTIEPVFAGLAAFWLMASILAIRRSDEVPPLVCFFTFALFGLFVHGALV